MKKRFFTEMIVVLVVLLAMSIGGCGKKDKQTEVTSGGDTASTGGSGEEDASSYAGGAVWGDNCEGSAISLDGTTAIVSIYVHNESEPFDKKARSSIKNKVKTAADFIESSAKGYKVKTKLVCNKNDLEVDYPYSGDSLEDFEAEDYDAIMDEISEGSIDVNEIRKKYKADGILYLFLIDSEGDAFASPHWIEDGPDYFSEGAFVFVQAYNEDYDAVPVGPDVIVRQILTTFGAIDLEYPDATYGYTTKLCDAARNKYSNDVMLSVYEDDGSINENKCTKKITDITAFSLGLINDFAELSDNPMFKKNHRYSFEDCYFQNNGENDEHAEEYEWVDEWEDIDEIGFDEEWTDEELDIDNGMWLESDDVDWEEIEEDAEAEDEERTE